MFMQAMQEGYFLLVEDNLDDEELTLRALQKSRIHNHVEVVRDGSEALDFFFGNEAQLHLDFLPQLVLLDLKLPKVDGLEVLKALRSHEKTKNLPIVIFSSSLEEQDIKNSYLLGANSYVRKPVDYAQFVDTVRQLGMYWLVLNQSHQAKSESIVLAE
jgi:two-component system, response regulator